MNHLTMGCSTPVDLTSKHNLHNLTKYLEIIHRGLLLFDTRIHQQMNRSNATTFFGAGNTRLVSSTAVSYDGSCPQAQAVAETRAIRLR